jgi:hypothetical protein
MAPIEKLVTWDEACSYIKENTVESLAKLGRSTEQFATYQAFQAKVGGSLSAWLYGAAATAHSSVNEMMTHLRALLP